jgi:hypothetical protein
VSYANGKADHYCGITDTMVVTCRCPDDPDQRETYLLDYAKYLVAHGGQDVPHSWRGLKRIITRAT